jgi:hypothetical protein
MAAPPLVCVSTGWYLFLVLRVLVTLEGRELRYSL